MSEESRQVLLDRKIARIIQTYAEKYHVTLDEAADTFYTSDVAQLVEERIADMHCLSEGYLAEELWLEKMGK